MDIQNLEYARLQVQKYLKANDSHLGHPTQLAVLTDTGLRMVGTGFTTDGTALSQMLDKEVIGLRSITRASRYWGAAERLQISIEGMRQLALTQMKAPGRKMAVWISPGWPLLTGPQVELGAKQQEEIFANVVGMNTLLQQARLTVYAIDPLGQNESLFRTNYYEEYLKGAERPRDVYLADLSLQVLAVQSGGLALAMNNDVAGQIQQCADDADAYYEITYNPPLETKPDEYHKVEVKLENSDLKARTKEGYYAQPRSAGQQKMPLNVPPPTDVRP